VETLNVWPGEAQELLRTQVLPPAVPWVVEEFYEMGVGMARTNGCRR
jgi:hypothetical protein